MALVALNKFINPQLRENVAKNVYAPIAFGFAESQPFAAFLTIYSTQFLSKATCEIADRYPKTDRFLFITPVESVLSVAAAQIVQIVFALSPQTSHQAHLIASSLGFATYLVLRPLVNAGAAPS